MSSTRNAGAPSPRIMRKPESNISSGISGRTSTTGLTSILADSASAEYLWDCLVDAMTEFSGATIKLEAFNAKFFGPID